MLKLSDLALRPDLQLGPMLVSPSRRLVEGPGGHAHVEPLIMQVFLLLLDAGGKVVTRTQLFDQCWGGVIVGDDSLNRVIAKVRRTGAQVAPGLFEIETIPRTGYRLTGEILQHFNGQAETIPGKAATPRWMSRRMIIGAGAATAAALGGLGLWSIRSRENGRFNELMRRGEERLSYGDSSANSSQYFERAVAMRPDHARAQGLFAYAQAMRASYAPEPGNAFQVADGAARAALALDPKESNARLALTILQRSSLDFAGTEDRLRDILQTAPANIAAMRQLWNLLQCVGRSRDALALVERAIEIEPFGASNHFPRAQLLWILGSTAEADRVIDQAMQYWPAHRFVRFARFTIFAFTDRPRAALAMLESRETAPQQYSPEAIALWRISLAALDLRTPASIEAARDTNLDAAMRNPLLSSQAVLTLSALGEIDAAFQIANALFVVPSSRGNGPPAKSTAWRFTPWLFTPPTKALRKDPRFVPLCNESGLTEYWAKRGIKPDYQLGIT
jgi:DNA-binding winged helix-turn-helix (wHTH) protein/tetratricopeptide (TPR) repeat protein